jgi:hypothetical protein
MEIHQSVPAADFAENLASQILGSVAVLDKAFNATWASTERAGFNADGRILD